MAILQYKRLRKFSAKLRARIVLSFGGRLFVASSVFAQDVPIDERSHRSDKLAWKLIAGRRLTTVYSKGSLRMKATPQFIPKQPHRRKMEMQQNVQRLPLLAFVLETLIAICIVAVLSTFAFWSLLKVYGLIP